MRPKLAPPPTATKNIHAVNVWDENRYTRHRIQDTPTAGPPCWNSEPCNGSEEAGISPLSLSPVDCHECLSSCPGSLIIELAGNPRPSHNSPFLSPPVFVPSRHVRNPNLPSVTLVYNLRLGTPPYIPHGREQGRETWGKAIVAALYPGSFTRLDLAARS